jgi:hypothetical protein
MFKVAHQTFEHSGARATDRKAYIFSSDHHVPVVQLYINMGILVEKLFSATRRSKANQFPIIHIKLMATRCLKKDTRKEYKLQTNCDGAFPEMLAKKNNS